MASNSSIEMLQIVADGLGDLNNRVVFVGGATAGFYATNPGAPEARPTMDVDCLVELVSYSELADLESQLRSLGFENDKRDSAPLCRWIYRGITVDIMPPDPSVLGFTNRWYKDGMRSAIERELPNKKTIRTFSPAYFIASKMEAFRSRGVRDMRTSPDFEDIIYVLDNRVEIIDEVTQANQGVCAYIRTFLKDLLGNPNLDEGLSAALPIGAGQAGIQRIRNIMQTTINGIR